MIVGLGTDIVRVSRIVELQNKYHNKFAEKILTLDERMRLNSMTADKIIKYLAKRFAAKEALVKALGVGFSENTSLQDISIKNDKHGKPYYNITDTLDGYIKKVFAMDKYNMFVSISDDIEYASAVAIIEKV